MEYSNFQNLVKETLEAGGYLRDDWDGKHLSKTWVIGDPSNGLAEDTDPEPGFGRLDIVLEVLHPSITLLQYNRLLREQSSYQVVYKHRSSDEAKVSIPLRGLYNWLKENKLLD